MKYERESQASRDAELRRRARWRAGVSAVLAVLGLGFYLFWKWDSEPPNKEAVVPDYEVVLDGLVSEVEAHYGADFTEATEAAADKQYTVFGSGRHRHGRSSCTYTSPVWVAPGHILPEDQRAQRLSESPGGPYGDFVSSKVIPIAGSAAGWTLYTSRDPKHGGNMVVAFTFGDIAPQTAIFFFVAVDPDSC